MADIGTSVRMVVLNNGIGNARKNRYGRIYFYANCWIACGCHVH